MEDGIRRVEYNPDSLDEDPMFSVSVNEDKTEEDLTPLSHFSSEDLTVDWSMLITEMEVEREHEEKKHNTTATQRATLVQNKTRKTKEHPANEKFKCDLCPRVFRHSSNMSRHRGTHMTSFPCHRCGFVLKRKDYLKGHLNSRYCRIHSAL